MAGGRNKTCTSSAPDIWARLTAAFQLVGSATDQGLGAGAAEATAAAIMVAAAGKLRLSDQATDSAKCLAAFLGYVKEDMILISICLQT
jgi:hypothetical protein